MVARWLSIQSTSLWAQWATDELLEDVPHRQLVFTIPKRPRVYFRYDRALLGELASCAWRALRLWIVATLGDDTAMPGAIGFIQTAGALLNFHPHLHLLITDGVLEPDGSFERLPYPDSRQIEQLFRAELLRMLMDEGLICQDVVDNLLSWRHSGFSVHAEVTVPDRVSTARLGRYMIRCPVVLERQRARRMARRGTLPPVASIIAFILDHGSIRRILAHIRMPAQRPEPLAHSPPLQDELSYA